MGINGVGSFYAQNYDVQNRGRSTRAKSSVENFMSKTLSHYESSDDENGTGLTAVDNGGSVKDSNMDYQRIISERKNEIYEKLKNGDTEESFQIGGSSFTEKEWDKLLSEVDDITEEMREAMREEHQKRFAETVEEKSVNRTESVDSTDAISKLFDTENTDIIDSADNTSKEISARVYSAEEMHKMQMEIIAANEKKLKAQQGSYEEMYKRLHPDYNGERIFRLNSGAQLYTANEIDELRYKEFLNRMGVTEKEMEQMREEWRKQMGYPGY